MCNLCNYEGSYNMCPICECRMPCNVKYRHCVCNNCLYNYTPYTKKNNNSNNNNKNKRVIYYSYDKKLWIKKRIFRTS